MRKTFKKITVPLLIIGTIIIAILGYKCYTLQNNYYFLFERAMNKLEDGDWKGAKTYVDKADNKLSENNLIIINDDLLRAVIALNENNENMALVEYESALWEMEMFLCLSVNGMFNIYLNKGDMESADELIEKYGTLLIMNGKENMINEMKNQLYELRNGKDNETNGMNEEKN